MGEFAAGLNGLNKTIRREQIRAMRKSGNRMDNALENARRRVPGGGHLSRLGRATGHGTRQGATLGVNKTVVTDAAIIWRAKGPWQIVDSSISGGPTAPHPIGPRPDVNARPLTPATRYFPSMEFRGGGFHRETYMHQGSPRVAAWAGAIQSTQPTITKIHRKAFYDAMIKTLGRG